MVCRCRMVRAPDIISLKITLRYKSLDEFIDRYRENVSSAGLFLRTKSPKATGTKIRFDLLLSGGKRALRGEGVVVTIREGAKPGMALRFNLLDPESKTTVERLVERHGEGTLAPTPLSTRFGRKKTAGFRSERPTSSPGWRPGRASWTPDRKTSQDPAPSRYPSPPLDQSTTGSGARVDSASEAVTPPIPSLSPWAHIPKGPTPDRLEITERVRMPNTVSILPRRELESDQATETPREGQGPTEDRPFPKPKTAPYPATSGSGGAPPLGRSPPRAGETGSREPLTEAETMSRAGHGEFEPKQQQPDAPDSGPSGQQALDAERQPPKAKAKGPLGPEAPDTGGQPQEAKDTEPLGPQTVETETEPHEAKDTGPLGPQTVETEAEPHEAKDTGPLGPQTVETETEPHEAKDTGPLSPQALHEAQPHEAKDTGPLGSQTLDTAPQEREAQAIVPLSSETLDTAPQNRHAHDPEPSSPEKIDNLSKEHEANDTGPLEKRPLRAALREPDLQDADPFGSISFLEEDPTAAGEPDATNKDRTESGAGDPVFVGEVSLGASVDAPIDADETTDTDQDRVEATPLPPFIEETLNESTTDEQPKPVFESEQSQPSEETDPSPTSAALQGDRTPTPVTTVFEPSLSWTDEGPPQKEESEAPLNSGSIESPLDDNALVWAMDAPRSIPGTPSLGPPVNVTPLRPDKIETPDLDTKDIRPPSGGDPSPWPPASRTQDLASSDVTDQQALEATGTPPPLPSEWSDDIQPASTQPASDPRSKTKDLRPPQSQPDASEPEQTEAITEPPSLGDAPWPDVLAKPSPMPFASDKNDGSEEVAAPTPDPFFAEDTELLEEEEPDAAPHPDPFLERTVSEAGPDLSAPRDGEEASPGVPAEFNALAFGHQAPLSPGIGEPKPALTTGGQAPGDRQPHHRPQPLTESKGGALPEVSRSPAGLEGNAPPVDPSSPAGLEGNAPPVDPSSPAGLEGNAPPVDPSSPAGLEGSAPPLGPSSLAGLEGSAPPLGPGSPAGLDGGAPPVGPSSPPIEAEEADTGDQTPWPAEENIASNLGMETSLSPPVPRTGLPPLESGAPASADGGSLNADSPPSMAPKVPRPEQSMRSAEAEGNLDEPSSPATASRPEADEEATLQEPLLRTKVSVTGLSSAPKGMPTGPSISRRPPLNIERFRPAIEREPSRPPSAGVKATAKSQARVGSERPAQALPDKTAPCTIGIDWGGQWIRIGAVRDGTFELVDCGDGHYLPALVAARPDGTLCAGKQARSIFLEDPRQAISPRTVLKAVRGQNVDPSFATIRQKNEGGKLMIGLGHAFFDLRDILRTLFRAILGAIKRHVGQTRFKSILSIPAGLDPHAETMLEEACRDQDLRVIGFSTEGEALLHAFKRETADAKVAVYVDLGLTHLMLCLARRNTNNLDIVEETWANEPSGRSLHTKAVEIALRELNNRYREDHHFDASVRSRLLHAAEKALGATDDKDALNIAVALPVSEGAGKTVVERSISIPLEQFHTATESIVSSVISKIQALLDKHHVLKETVDVVVVAGTGATFSPLIAAITQWNNGKAPLTPRLAPKIFALGLVRKGEVLTHQPKPPKAALEASVGISLPGGRFRPLIPVGTSLPINLKRHHSTTRDNQTEVELQLYQGEGENIGACTQLGTIILRGIRKAPRGGVNISLELDVDADGVLTVLLSEHGSKATEQQTFATIQTPVGRRQSLGHTPAPKSEASRPAQKPPAMKGFLKKLFKKR